MHFVYYYVHFCIVYCFYVHMCPLSFSICPARQAYVSDTNRGDRSQLWVPTSTKMLWLLNFRWYTVSHITQGNTANDKHVCCVCVLFHSGLHWGFPQGSSSAHQEISQTTDWESGDRMDIHSAGEESPLGQRAFVLEVLLILVSFQSDNMHV